MEIQCLPLGAYQANCYLLWDEASPTCAVIDPGYEADRVLRAAAQAGKTVEAVLLTHGHFDHVGAVRDIAAETGCRVYLCPEDLSMPPQFTAGPLFYTDTYGEGDRISVAGISVRVLHTPGHTPGSVCLLAEDVLFSGDTLFSGSCGRTDLPGGSTPTILKSLKRLSSIPENLRVLPGHGEETTLGEEKRYNPYLGSSPVF